MVQPGIVGDLVERMAGTCLFIRGAVNHGGNSRLNDRTGTHGARFQRGVERAIEQSPRPQGFRGLGDRDHFCVRSWIVKLLALVPRRADDAVVVNNNYSNRNFAFFKRLPSLVESSTHPKCMRLQQFFVGVRHENSFY